jgi:hypothetical protein
LIKVSRISAAQITGIERNSSALQPRWTRYGQPGFRLAAVDAGIQVGIEVVIVDRRLGLPVKPASIHPYSLNPDF